MKKNLIKSTLAVAFLTVAGLGGMKVYEKHNTFNEDDLLSLNIEALSQEEWTEPKWTIHPYDCTIKGACRIRLGNGSVINIKADGEFVITGARDCSGDGTYACEPISCSSLYTVIFN